MPGSYVRLNAAQQSTTEHTEVTEHHHSFSGLRHTDEGRPIADGHCVSSCCLWLAKGAEMGGSGAAALPIWAPCPSLT
jgi:hypothetical protein